MRYYNKYLHSILLTLTFMGLSFIGFFPMDDLVAQVKETDSTNESSVQKSLLFAGAAYGSDFIYMGSSISRHMPYYSGSLTYGLGNSLYISVSASHLSKTSPYVAFYSLSASYRHTVNSWFDYSIDLAGYKTPESLQNILFSDFALINLTTGFDWKLIYTKLSFGGLLSNASSGYVQIRNSHYFQTTQFFKGKAFLSFDPNINLLFGRLVKIESTTGITRFGNAPLFVQTKKKQTNATFSYSYIFGMMDTEFSVPVTLNFTKFSIEAETIYILPTYSNPDYPAPKGFSINISAYFRIL